MPMFRAAGWSPLCRQDAMTSACFFQCCARAAEGPFLSGIAAQLIFRFRHILRASTAHLAWLLALIMMILFIGGCQYKQPTANRSPWLPQRQVWAIAPLSNESGLSHLDRLAVSDALLLEAASIDGVDVIPLNRTLEVMMTMGIGQDGTPSEAEYRHLAEVLGVDAILVGTIFDFDPYPPLRFGATIFLIPSGEPQLLAGFDPRALTMSVGGRSQVDQDQFSSDQGPMMASGVFDAENHAVLMALETYAYGRTSHNPARADVGLYLLDMDDYEEFAFHELLGKLLVSTGVIPAPDA